MSTFKRTWTILFVILSSNFYSQNSTRNKIDSVKRELLQLLKQSTAGTSDVMIYTKVGKRDAYTYSSDLVSDVISISDLGVTFTTSDGTHHWIFSDTLRFEKFGCPHGKDLKRHTKGGITSITVAKCTNKNISIDFEAKISSIPLSCAKTQDMAQDFCKKFNYLVGESKNLFVEFEKDFKIAPSAGGTPKTITEDQRKLIVQANYLNEQKEYAQALEYYEKAMKIDPYSYPEAYYNMALIASELKFPEFAIINMKKYLLIRPNAEDARKAQDKIYEWEINIKK